MAFRPAHLRYAYGWPGVLLVEQKSAGINLAVARKQAGTYFDALPERDRPRYQLLCNFNFPTRQKDRVIITPEFEC